MEDWRDDISATLYYSHTLTLAGHGTTWFRCEITWGGQKVRGENYKNLQNCYGATWSLFPYQKGVQITPCTDSFVEVPAEESLTLSCSPQTQSMEWRLSLGGSSYLSAKFENGQYVQKNLPFDVNSDPGKISLTINTSNTRNITLVNGTVVCQDLSQSPPSSSNCGLNYVYKPKPNDISCQATADANGDKLYCTINNIYSSRGIYTCQALRREEQNSEVERLNTVNMATLNDGGGLKVSGRCNITTDLPVNAGNYSYSVKISPGGLEAQANLPDGERWIEHFGITTTVGSQAAIYNVPTVWLLAALVLLQSCKK
ncbi:uncharacterized protein LOC112568361 isoform X1 [Pomacea canaliculata]|uniref:uncharacterized protein LOC112568361 isoform X1 n=1 Tax=Pomacea canaliculata TaxID=400727 RepID=UPI000D72AB3F|nr:uncharacterized protein LOC112568361 isoform X1 [Pomacea canaliculata]